MDARNEIGELSSDRDTKQALLERLGRDQRVALKPQMEATQVPPPPLYSPSPPTSHDHVLARCPGMLVANRMTLTRSFSSGCCGRLHNEHLSSIPAWFWTLVLTFLLHITGRPGLWQRLVGMGRVSYM